MTYLEKLKKLDLHRKESKYAERICSELVYLDNLSDLHGGKYDALIEGGLLPISRWGTPEDIANAVSVLAEGKLMYSTGEVINVDGGFHIQRL